MITLSWFYNGTLTKQESEIESSLTTIQMNNKLKIDNFDMCCGVYTITPTIGVVDDLRCVHNVVVAEFLLA